MTWSSRSKEEGGTEWEIMKHVDAVAVELVVVGYKVMMVVVVVVLATEEMMWATTTNCNVCVVKHLLHVSHWPSPSN